MSLAAVRDNIAGVQVAGLRGYDTVVGNPVPDCFIVGFPDEFDPHAAFGDTVDFTIPVHLHIKFASNRRADVEMEKYLATSGATSLIAAIEELGAAYTCSRVRDINPTTIGADPGVKVLACVIDVRVLS